MLEGWVWMVTQTRIRLLDQLMIVVGGRMGRWRDSGVIEGKSKKNEHMACGFLEGPQMIITRVSE